MKKLLGIFSAVSLSLISFAQVDSFTTSGTYIVPQNVFSINVEVVGAGGKGGSNGGGGGGGGGYSFGTFAVTPGASLTVTVGQAAGQTTSVSTLGIQATAGSNGGGGSTALGGNGGTGSGGTINRAGGNGGQGHYTYYGGGGGGAGGSIGNGTVGVYPGPPAPPNYQNPGGAGGAGGGYPGGTGGKGAGAADPNFNTTNPATPGNNYGGGGGGGNGISSPASNGSSGFVKISVAGTPVQTIQVTTQNAVPAVITTNGGTLQTIATVLPASANQAVIWSLVPGTGSATINASGLVTATGNGTVWAKAVSVQNPAKSDSIQITISNQVVSITDLIVATQNNVAPIINVTGGTLQMTATILPSSANQDVTWTLVPGTGNALISSSGLVTAIADGTVWAKAVSVQDASKLDSMLVTISNQPANAITDVVVGTQSNVSPVIDVNNGLLQLVSTVIPLSANQSVTWSLISGTGSATINPSGLVTAMTNGTVWGKAVSVADPNFSDSILITISNQGVGIMDLSLAGIELFPNPAQDKITLSSGIDLEVVSIEMLDIQGRVVYADRQTQLLQGQSKEIDLSRIGSGFYFFKIQSEGNSRVIKIIKN